MVDRHEATGSGGQREQQWSVWLPGSLSAGWQHCGSGEGGEWHFQCGFSARSRAGGVGVVKEGEETAKDVAHGRGFCKDLAPLGSQCLGRTLALPHSLTGN